MSVPSNPLLSGFYAHYSLFNILQTKTGIQTETEIVTDVATVLDEGIETVHEAREEGITTDTAAVTRTSQLHLVQSVKRQLLLPQWT